MAIRLLSGETIDGGATFAGIITVNSSSSGDYVRMYGSSGTGKWDIYGSGNNLRISENTASGTGILTVDRGATFAGDVTVQGGNKLILNNSVNTGSGSIVCPGGGSLALQAYGNNMIYLNENTDIRFSTSSSEKMRLDSAGNLIVNDTSSDLSASGRGVVEINGTSQAILGLKVNGDVKTYLFQNGNNVELNNTASGSLTLKTAATTALTIDSSQNVTFSGNATFAGNVLIGATSAAAGVLVVDGNSANNIWVVGRDSDGTGSLSFRNAADNAYNARLEAVSGALKFETNGTLALTIDASQNVGIGQAPSTAKLEVAGEARVYTGSNLGYWGVDSGNSYVYFGTNSSGYGLSFQTSGAEKMRLDSSGNLGINETIPNAKLDVSGNVKLGSAAHSSWTDAKQDSGGLGVFVGSGSYAFQVWDDNDQTNARFVVERAGNVGIGTTSPSQKLHVEGLALIKNNTSGLLYLYDTSNSIYGDINGDAIVTAGNSLRFTVNSSERMRIDSSGQVGIGTTAPASKLQVRIGGIGSNANDEVDGVIFEGDRHDLIFKQIRTSASSDWNNTTFRLQNRVDSTLMSSIDFVTDASFERHIDINTASNSFNTRFLHSGDVCIGTTSHQGKLTVVGATQTCNFDLDANAEVGLSIMGLHTSNKVGITIGKANSSKNSGVFRYVHSSDGGNTNYVGIGHYAADDILNVTSGGNVGIGTTSPSAKLEIVTAVGADAIRMNYGQSADIFLGFGSANPRILLQDNSNVVTHNFISNGDNYIVGSNVGIGNTSPSQKLHVTGTILASSDVVAFSDIKLKENIKTLDGSKVYDMRGVTFIKDNKQSSGVIAQELEKIAPELVNNDSEFKAVAYGNISGYLIEAIKDLKAEIEELKKSK